MVTVDQSIPEATRDPSGLRRDVGLIGLTWASVGSIIGSGWLYGAHDAVIQAGPSAIISWVIGAVAIVLLALVHAELGGMFPVAGGTARYPHYAFGGLAGMSFGWFSWLQAATVAPIEVEAMIGYAGHWKWAKHFQLLQAALRQNETADLSPLCGAADPCRFGVRRASAAGCRGVANTDGAAERRCEIPQKLLWRAWISSPDPA